MTPLDTRPDFTCELPPPTTPLGRELLDIVGGEVRDDPCALSLYATDASLYEIEPLVVVYPSTEEDVRACVRLAAYRGVPVMARGGGSGLTGESLGRGVILDLSVHLTRVLGVDVERRTATVQPGVVLDDLNRRLKPQGLCFGPDPSSGSRCTLGGMIANNATGAHSLRHGSTREHLRAARAVLADATSAEFRAVELDGPEHTRWKAEAGLAGQVHRELPALLARHAAALAQRRHRAERDRSGYLLQGILNGTAYAPQRLLCASEGTLAILTEAVLDLKPLPGPLGLVLVYFASLVEAGRAVPAIRETNPAACELFDATIMRLGREIRPAQAEMLPESAGAMLAVEYETPAPGDLEARLQALTSRLARGVAHLSLRAVAEPREQAALWATRKAAAPLLFRRPDGLVPVPLVEDAAVPVDRLADYLAGTIRVFGRHGLAYSAYGHAGDGEPHIRPFMDLRRPEHVGLLEQLAEECNKVVWECEGTVSGEHGEGLARTQFIAPQAGPELYAAFCEVKKLFDPAGRLNPGKKISSDAHLLTRDLRVGLPAEAEGREARALAWAPGALAAEVLKCNGCGQCRSTGADVGMCPRFRYHRFEDAAPRAKANVLRRLLNGEQVEDRFSEALVLELLGYCFHCKLCSQDCPSGVNVSRLVREAEARAREARPLGARSRLFARAEQFARLALPFGALGQACASSAPARWALEWFYGLDRRRALPPVRRLSLRHQHAPGGERPEVVLYLDLYARYYAPEIAQAALDVLEHNGFSVLIPGAPWTNPPLVLHGSAEEARAQVRAVVSALAPHAARGLAILCPEPTATLCLKEEFPACLDTPEVGAVARQTQDLLAFLRDLHGEKKLRTDFRALALTAGYHRPCHVQALRQGTPALDLLRLVPGVETEFIQQGCCGLAGSFGMYKQHYAEAMWLGQGLFGALKQPRLAVGLSDCSTCRAQMVHGSGKPARHPIEILAEAYGSDGAGA